MANIYLGLASFIVAVLLLTSCSPITPGLISGVVDHTDPNSSVNNITFTDEHGKKTPLYALKQDSLLIILMNNQAEPSYYPKIVSQTAALRGRTLAVIIYQSPTSFDTFRQYVSEHASNTANMITLYDPSGSVCEILGATPASVYVIDSYGSIRESATLDELKKLRQLAQKYTDETQLARDFAYQADMP